MSSLLKMALVLSLVDRFTGPARQADSTLKGMGKTAGELSGKFGRLAEKAKLFSGQIESMKNAGRNTMIGGLAAGGLLGLGSVPGDAAKAEHSIRALGNVGNLTNNQLKGINSSLLDTTLLANQFQADLIKGINTLVAAGLDPRVATRFMPTIGKAATATQSEVDDLAKTMFAVYDNLKVPEAQLMKSIDTLAASGKEGRFELNNMARFFPMLTAGAQSLGMKGVPAVASLGAALQIAMKGAGSPEEAATNFQNFLQKITSKDTVKNFSKFGINVEQEMKRATEKGLDPIEHMLNVIMKVTGGNKFKLGEIFGDMQVTNFLVPMMKNLAEYRGIRDRTMNASGVVDKDYQAMMGTTIEQWKSLKITLAKIAMPNLAGPMSLVNGMLKVLTGNAFLAKLTFYGIAGTVIGGGLLFSLGAMASILPKVAAGLVMVGKAKVVLLTAIKGGALAGLGTAALFVVAIGSVIAAGYQLWKHWNTLKQPGFFKDLVGWIKELGGSFFKAGANIVSSLWNGIKSMASKPVDAMKAIATKVRALLPFSPAKEGPLRDIHRIRLIETIADAMKPRPMVNAMRTAVGAVAAVGMVATGAGAAGSGVTIHYNPQITIQGMAGAGVQNDIMAALRQHQDELLRLVEQAQAKAGRGKF